MIFLEVVVVEWYEFGSVVRFYTFYENIKLTE